MMPRMTLTETLFICFVNAEISGSFQRAEPSSLFNLDAKVFDDWIREHVARHTHRFIARLLFTERAVDHNLKVFTLADVADAVKAQQFDRMFDGLALRIKDAGFQGDEDFGFHS